MSNAGASGLIFQSGAVNPSTVARLMAYTYDDSDSDDQLARDDNILDDDYDQLIDDIRAIEAPAMIHPVIPREMIEVSAFDPNHNILNPDVRDRFRDERIFEETALFTAPISTTNTMEGYLSNVDFHERDLIIELIPDERVVMYRCNYGQSVYDGYTDPASAHKTNRGRKKKNKNKKPRKKQGDGGSFNSQVTFVVRSMSTPEPVYNDGTSGSHPHGCYLIPHGTPVYKFKIFRTGKLQLPGAHQHLMGDVVDCAKTIANILNFHLHAGESNPSRLCNVININPVMKNYKFVTKLPPVHIIDIGGLKRVLHNKRFLADPEAPPHPAIFMMKYTRQDTKLSIKFSTPIYRKPKKKTQINIFMRGKINILGAFDADVTRQICDYLHWIFTKYADQVIVHEGGIEPTPLPPYIWVANIADDDAEAIETIALLAAWLPALPCLPQSEYDALVNIADRIYDSALADVNDFLREWLDAAC